jgi:hypothetical protein
MFNKKETEQLLACMDAAIKQSQDSFSAAVALAPIRDKMINSLKESAEDLNEPTQT